MISVKEKKIKAKKRRYHKGEEERYFYDGDIIPDGFIKGGKPCDRSVVEKRLATRKKLRKEGKYKSSKGYIAWHSDSKEIYLPPEQLPPEGFIKGRLPQNISKALAGHKKSDNSNWQKIAKNRKAYHKGDILIYINPGEPVPDGFIEGALAKTDSWKQNMSVNTTGKHCITDGTVDTWLAPGDPLPDGWRIGSCHKRSAQFKKKHSMILSSVEVQSKRNRTLSINKSWNISNIEESYYEKFCETYGEENVFRQYNLDSRYPFNCDFYIKPLDLFIEINAHWTHGNHPFDVNSQEDIKKLNLWIDKSATSKFYKNAIKVWTQNDVEKYTYAVKNNLHYLMIYNKGKEFWLNE